jgi:hypothetical protein
LWDEIGANSPLRDSQSPAEHYYTLCWLRDLHNSDTHYVCVAGERGIIRVIDAVLSKENAPADGAMINTKRTKITGRVRLFLWCIGMRFLNFELIFDENSL